MSEKAEFKPMKTDEAAATTSESSVALPSSSEAKSTESILPTKRAKGINALDEKKGALRIDLEGAAKQFFLEASASLKELNFSANQIFKMYFEDEAAQKHFCQWNHGKAKQIPDWARHVWAKSGRKRKSPKPGKGQKRQPDS